MLYCIKIKTTTALYRFIRLSFDKITDVRNMQIFNKVYQTGVSGDLHCCTYLAYTDMLRCLSPETNENKMCERLMTGRATD